MLVQHYHTGKYLTSSISIRPSGDPDESPVEVGNCVIVEKPSGPPHYYSHYLENITINSTFRGWGYGAQLLKRALIELGINHPKARVKLIALADAVDFYKRLPFCHHVKGLVFECEVPH